MENFSSTEFFYQVTIQKSKFKNNIIEIRKFIKLLGSFVKSKFKGLKPLTRRGETGKNFPFIQSYTLLGRGN